VDKEKRLFFSMSRQGPRLAEVLTICATYRVRREGLALSRLLNVL